MAEIDVHKRVRMVAFARVWCYCGCTAPAHRTDAPNGFARGWRYRRSVHGSVFVGLMAISTSAP